MSFDSQKRTNNKMTPSITNIQWYRYLPYSQISIEVTFDQLLEEPKTTRSWLIVPDSLLPELQGLELIYGRTFNKLPWNEKKVVLFTSSLIDGNQHTYPYDVTALAKDHFERAINKLIIERSKYAQINS